MKLQDCSTSQLPDAVLTLAQSNLWKTATTKVAALEFLNGRSMILLQPPYSAKLG